MNLQHYPKSREGSFTNTVFTRVLSIILCSFCFFFVANAQSYYQVTSNSLSVRSRPSSKAKVLGRLNKGDKIAVESSKSGWATITYKKKKGYVLFKYLKAVEEPKQSSSSKNDQAQNKDNYTSKENAKNTKKDKAKDTPKSDDITTYDELLYTTTQSHNYKVKSKKASVYKEPSTKSKRLGTLNRNDKVTIEDLDNEWGHINYKKHDGYVLKSDFEILPDVASNKKQEKEKTAKTNKYSKAKEPHKFAHALFAEGYGCYTNFMCSSVSPVFGFGFGADVAYEFAKKNLVTNKLEGYFAEASVGYARKGSGAYPLDYIIARVYPGGYRYSVSDKIQLMGKAGGYFGYSFSSIEGYDDCNIDYGVVGAIGVSYDKYSLWVSYEHGFKKFTNLKMNNMAAYLTFSYRFFLK
jgi:uncharacterized protein YgiM (DUF1202 family)